MKVRYTKLALQDLRSVIFYTTELYDRRKVKVILGYFREVVSKVVEFPEVGKKGRVSGTREIAVPKTPFIIVYKVEKTEIHILAVLHSSRKWF